MLSCPLQPQGRQKEIAEMVQNRLNSSVARDLLFCAKATFTLYNVQPTFPRVTFKEE